MKSLYKAPKVKLEELLKQDVLCASGETETSNEISGQIDNYSVSNTSWRDLADLL